MTAVSTTWRRLWSFWIDGIPLIEPSGSNHALSGMTTKEMRAIQKLGAPDRAPNAHG